MNWWKEGILLDIRVSPMGVVIAAVYALACLFTRQLSLDQFYLPAGVRISALLLTPVRLWPYLLLGEYAYFAQIRLPMVPTHGLAWVILGSIALMPAAMLVVHIHRRSLAIASGLWLLSLALSAGILVSLLNMGIAALLWPNPDPEMMPNRFGRTLLGQIMGILTLAPLALLWIRRHCESSPGARLTPPAIAAIALIIMLGLAMKIVPASAGGTREHLVLLASLPAIALVFIRGWRGAATAVPLLNVFVLASTPSTGLPASFDPGAFSTQQTVAVISVALLALGSSISHYQSKYRERDIRGQNTARLARASHLAGERDLRSRALQLRSIGEGMEHSMTSVADWLRLHGHHDMATRLLRTSVAHSQQFREQASMIYPTTIEHIGLYLSLQAGGLRDAWELTGRMGRLHLAGDPCRLSVGLQLSAYRMLADAVPVMLGQHPGQLHIRARCGSFGQRCGIIMTLSWLERERVPTPDIEAALTERLGGRLIAYDGVLQRRRERISIVLSEPLPTTPHGRGTPPRPQFAHR